MVERLDVYRKGDKLSPVGQVIRKGKKGYKRRKKMAASYDGQYDNLMQEDADTFLLDEETGLVFSADGEYIIGGLDAALDEIDVVVNTHCHHDHSGSNRAVRDRTLVIGEGELEAAEAIYGPEFVHANFTGIMRQVQSVGLKDGLLPLDEGV